MEAGRFTRRQRHAGILVCALGVGLVAFTFLDGDSPSVSLDRRPPTSATSEASVLGVVITQPETTSLPAAAPASPVEIRPTPTSTRRATTTTARPDETSTTAPATSSTDPTLIDPTVIENTTTTTDAPPPTTIDLGTTTTAAPTTTEPPPG
jgi:hypothetical protein